MRKRGNARRGKQHQSAAQLQAMFRQGLALHQQGRLAEAERIYADVLQLQPDHFDALHLLGVIAAQTQRLERSVELIRKAIRVNPTVAGFTCSHEWYRNTITDTAAMETAKRKISRKVRALTATILVHPPGQKADQRN